MFTKEEFSEALEKSPLSLMSGDYYDREDNSGCALTIMYLHLHLNINHLAFTEDDFKIKVMDYWGKQMEGEGRQEFTDGFDGCLLSTKSPYYLLGKELRETYL